MLTFVQQSLAVFLKDIRLEWRSRFGVSTALAFIASSLLVVLFSLGADQLPLAARSGLIWIIVLFASLVSLARIFLSESERGTLDLLRLNATASAVYAGKLCYNFLFTLFISSVTCVLFIIMTDTAVADPGLLVVTLALGSLGLAGITTLLGALVSQATRKGALFPVLALPLLIPLMLILVRITESVFTMFGQDAYLDDLLALLGFAGVTISASVLLFEHLWED